MPKLWRVTTDNIRFYEEKGVLNPDRGEGNGYRYFTEAEALQSNIDEYNTHVEDICENNILMVSTTTTPRGQREHRFNISPK